MGDAEDVLPPSKKRAAGRELSRDNPGIDDDEDASEQDTGTFEKASDEVLASRRIVKVRRQQPASAPSSNPFAGICLVPPQSSAPPAEVPIQEKTAKETIQPEDGDREDDATKETAESSAENNTAKKSNDGVSEAAKTEGGEEAAGRGDKNDNEGGTSGRNVDQNAESTPLNSFGQLSSSQNAFTGLAGAGFSSSSFSFGTIAKDVTAFGASSLAGPKDDQSSPFSFGISTNGSSSFFSSTAVASIVSKSVGSSFPSLQDVPVETGEENEKTVFSADSILFEFIDGGWKERGKGELKLNVSKAARQKARLVMRARGNYRLILNACLYADMKLASMDKKGVTFTCLNSTNEEKKSLSTLALKFKDVSVMEEFRAAVEANKGEIFPVLKTPENSPEALDA